MPTDVEHAGEDIILTACTFVPTHMFVPTCPKILSMLVRTICERADVEHAGDNDGGGGGGSTDDDTPASVHAQK